LPALSSGSPVGSNSKRTSCLPAGRSFSDVTTKSALPNVVVNVVQLAVLDEQGIPTGGGAHRSGPGGARFIRRAPDHPGKRLLTLPVLNDAHRNSSSCCMHHVFHRRGRKSQTWREAASAVASRARSRDRNGRRVRATSPHPFGMNASGNRRGTLSGSSPRGGLATVWTPPSTCAFAAPDQVV
jgi:hypothetical protein